LFLPPILIAFLMVVSWPPKKRSHDAGPASVPAADAENRPASHT